jgi:hypothetical protein
VHVVVAAGAVIAALNGIEAVARYWAIVLGAELACYAPLPYFRSRPPRAVEAPGVLAQRAPRLRRLNGAILDHTSVQVNTIPSGHVAGALAATLATFAVNEVAGLVLMAGAAMITAAAVLGRYHYVIDCALGVGVAVAAALLVA